MSNGDINTKEPALASPPSLSHAQRIARLEDAIAGLCEQLFGIGGPGQLAAKGEKSLAQLMANRREAENVCNSE